MKGALRLKELTRKLGTVICQHIFRLPYVTNQWSINNDAIGEAVVLDFGTALVNFK